MEPKNLKKITVNPGCIMGGHSIEEVKLGNSYIRNPLLANFCSKIMPYRGLGSGLPRVLSSNSQVDFSNDRQGNQFTVSIGRHIDKETIANDSVVNVPQNNLAQARGPQNDPQNDGKRANVPQNDLQNDLQRTNGLSLQQQIIAIIRDNCRSTRKQMAEKTGVSIKTIGRTLKQMDNVNYVGGAKNGYWIIKSNDQ